MRVSNTQRSLYLQCPRKYKYRYIHKMRAKDKGSALYFGTAFDLSSDILFNERDLAKAKTRFSELWMNHENNLSCKFSKTDLDVKLFNPSDLAKLEASVDSLNQSQAKKDYDKHQDVVKLVNAIKKMKDQSFMRDLTLEEERYLHYAHILCMNQKGHLMLEAFHRDILPHITEVISTQMKVDIKNPAGDTIIGYIDLLCKMAGYKLPCGRVLTDQDLVVADVKTAGQAYWDKLDNLDDSDQLHTYVCSPQVQSLSPTNIIAYMAVAKNISKDETLTCKSCGHVKASSHKTCNNEIDGKRCGGDWEGHVKYFSNTKIVIGECNLAEARKVYEDYDMVVRGIKAEVFPRCKDSCNAYGSVCEFKGICNKALDVEQEEFEINNWKDKYGE